LIGKFSLPEKEEPIDTIHELIQREKPWDIAFTVKNVRLEDACIFLILIIAK